MGIDGTHIFDGTQQLMEIDGTQQIMDGTYGVDN